MYCPKCESENVYVMESRTVDGNRIYRRRRCCDCGNRFNTLECEAGAVSARPVRDAGARYSGGYRLTQRRGKKEGI